MVAFFKIELSPFWTYSFLLLPQKEWPTPCCDIFHVNKICEEYCVETSFSLDYGLNLCDMLEIHA